MTALESVSVASLAFRMTKDMIVKCAWCGVAVESLGDEIQPEKISHTICSACKIKVLENTNSTWTYL